MNSQIKVEVNCPSCQKSLMIQGVKIDDLPAIEISAKISGKSGKVYLSQIYGSYQKKFVNVEDIPDTVVDCFCPKCQQPFPIKKVCSSCNAPVATLNLDIGGKINFCTRNGCPHHSVEFENLDSAFILFQKQNPSYYA
ncbi:MAG: hypothetical protein HQK73_08945 [Desulfamplus sp.]|nr:hypothetical protein [Desulfamplus sp.]MBF0413061.1 hypothetical protein [Desulfamplus sp.]